MKHVVGFSGGADSQATALWVRQRFPAEDIILVNADPGGNEAPETTEFIEWYSENIFPVHMIHPEVRDMRGKAKAKIAELGLQPTDPLTFDLLATLKGRFPSTKVRFCTDHLKLEPMRRWCYAQGAKGLNDSGRYGELPHVDGVLTEGYERYAGVRRDESRERANVDEHEFDDWFMCYLNRPLATWTKEQVFASLVDASEPFNPLYLKGFSRIGCAPCINAGKEDIRLWAAYSPPPYPEDSGLGNTRRPHVLSADHSGSRQEIRAGRGGRRESHAQAAPLGGPAACVHRRNRGMGTHDARRPAKELGTPGSGRPKRDVYEQVWALRVIIR